MCHQPAQGGSLNQITTTLWLMRKVLGKKKQKTKYLILPLILFQSPSYTATIGLKQKVVPSSLIAQGSVTLTIKIKPQSKTQINFLFQPYLKNQTKHNYC